MLRCWVTPPDHLAVEDDEVHVWRARTDIDGPMLETCAKQLSFDETARAERFRFAADRRRFVSARSFLRTVIGRYLQIEPAAVEFGYGPYGKPFLLNPPEQKVFAFNLSHSGCWALCAAASTQAVGVDVEQVRPDVEALDIAGRVFSPAEINALQALSGEARTRAFFQCWTQKEALVKALGKGLSASLGRFSVASTGLPQLLDAPAEMGAWQLFKGGPDNEHVGAVAVPGTGWKCRYFDMGWKAPQKDGMNEAQGARRGISHGRI